MTALRPFANSSQHYEAPAGAEFDGTNDWLLRGDTISSTTTGRLTLSLWFKPDSSVGGRLLHSPTAVDNLGIRAMPDDTIFCFFSGIFSFYTDSTYIEGVWNHLALSVDLEFTIGNRLTSVWLNGEESTISILSETGGVGLINWSSIPDLAIGTDANSVGAVNFTGGLSEYWLDVGTYTDFSIKANRRKFISNTKRPVFLGSDGSKPTGAQPALYLKGTGTGFNINSGTGGNFTTTGALTTPTTTPSKP